MRKRKRKRAVRGTQPASPTSMDSIFVDLTAQIEVSRAAAVAVERRAAGVAEASKALLKKKLADQKALFEEKMATQETITAELLSKLHDCAVCYDRKATHMMMPCRHLCVCTTCEMKLVADQPTYRPRECIMCRTPIRFIIAPIYTT